ncbi:MAG: helix-turn-helix domain-containing protein [Microbacteriaceae bacterium]|jgi:excisionase family DNA binding protein|nr:helix-turn-helix domain-containing protein [Microbacteriaceae bacterium]
MSPSLAIANDTLIIDETTRAEAAQIVRDARDVPIESVTVRIDGVEHEIPQRLSEVLLHVLKQTAVGGAVTVRTLPDEVTTTVAADMLGVSRPTLMKMISAGELSARQVGSHKRLKAADVLNLRDRRLESQRQSFARLRQLGI